MNEQIIKRKTIKVSAQRHLVIPKEYYDALNIGEEVTIELYEGQLVIKPVIKVSEDFAENLLDELIPNGDYCEIFICLLDEESAPMEHQVFIDLKNPIIEPLEDYERCYIKFSK